jgi:RNA polymerase sigma-70 factor (ECF subfamily)
MQDVFLSAMNRLGTLRAAAAFPGWLASIARHRALDHFREARKFAPLDDRVARSPGRDGAGAEALEVLELIRSLPEAYRETLILRLVEGMTGPEIAARTGLTPESVRVNLCRGMKMLRRLL